MSEDSFSTAIIHFPGVSAPPFPPPLRHTTSPDYNYFHSALGSYFKNLLLFKSYPATLHKNVSELFGLEGAFPFILGSKVKSESQFWVVR